MFRLPSPRTAGWLLALLTVAVAVGPADTLALSRGMSCGDVGIKRENNNKGQLSLVSWRVVLTADFWFLDS